MKASSYQLIPMKKSSAHKNENYRVLLLIPPRENSSVFLRSQYLPPIGLAYVAAFAREKAVKDSFQLKITIVDSTAERIRFSDLKELVTSEAPHVIGIHFYTENRFEAKETLEIIKKIDPKIITIAGGPHSTLATDDTIRNFKDLDIIVRGEGEVTFYELLKTLRDKGDLATISGISFKNKDSVVHNPDRPGITDIDSIPFPAYDLLKMDKYHGTIDWSKSNESMGMIVTSRGCPFQCNFCSSSKAWGRHYRVRTPENVIEEIDFLVKTYGITAFIFFDDTMTISKSRTISICNQIIDNHLSIRWITHSRVDVMDEELMLMMKKAGCEGIMFGVESGSQRIIDEVVGKKIKIDQAVSASNLGKKLGMVNNFSYIISHPTETPEEVVETLKMIQLHLKDDQTVALNIMRTYPGTGLEAYALKNNLLPLDFAWSKDMEYESGIISRTLKGNVPFFRDRLSWNEILHFNSQYLKMIKYPILHHAFDSLKNIRSLRDLADLIRLGFIHIWTLFERNTMK